MDPNTQFAINSSSQLNPTLLQLLRLSQFSSAPASAAQDLQQTNQATSLPPNSPLAQQQGPPSQAPQSVQSTTQQGDSSQSQADTDINSVGGPTPSSPQQQQQGNGAATGFLHGFLDNFQPQTAARTQLTNLMQNMPQYQEPGFFSKLEAGLIGATRGPQAAEQYLESPYNRQMNQWKNQAQVAQQAASDENYSNNLNRQLSQFAQGNQEKYDALTEKANEASGKLSAVQQRIQIYQQNADTNAAKLDVMRQTALGGQIQFLPDNTAIMVHKDGTSVPVTGADGNTPVLFSPQDKQQMINDAAMMREQAGQAGANQRNAATIANSAANNAANNANKGWTVVQDTAKDSPTYGQWLRVNQDTGQVIPVNLPGGAAKIGTKPSGAGAGPTTTTTQTETPGTLLGSTTLGRWFNEPPQVTKSTVTTKVPGATQPAQNQAVTTVHMQSPDGKTYSVNQEDVEASKAHGWKVIGG